MAVKEWSKFEQRTFPYVFDWFLKTYRKRLSKEVMSELFNPLEVVLFFEIYLEMKNHWLKFSVTEARIKWERWCDEHSVEYHLNYYLRESNSPWIISNGKLLPNLDLKRSES